MWVTLAPLLIQVVLKLIDWLIEDVSRRNKAKLSFLEFIKRDQSHLLDSVRIRKIYEQLLKENKK